MLPGASAAKFDHLFAILTRVTRERMVPLDVITKEVVSFAIQPFPSRRQGCQLKYAHFCGCLVIAVLQFRVADANFASGLCPPRVAVV